MKKMDRNHTKMFYKQKCTYFGLLLTSSSISPLAPLSFPSCDPPPPPSPSESGRSSSFSIACRSVRSSRLATSRDRVGLRSASCAHTRHSICCSDMELLLMKVWRTSESSGRKGSRCSDQSWWRDWIRSESFDDIA